MSLGAALNSLGVADEIIKMGGPAGKQVIEDYKQGKTPKEAFLGLGKDKEKLMLKAAQEGASERAASTIRQRAQSLTQSIFTNPLGISGQADVARKTLLGQ
jgi:uncharacterized protein YpmB